MKLFNFLLSTVIIFSVIGCSSTPVVKYKNPKDMQTVSADFSSTDLQAIVNSMVDSLLTSPAVILATTAKSPVISVSVVKNKTMQHIDTESVTDSIRAKLIQSGKFKFIDRTTDQAAIDEFNVQKNSGLVDPAKSVEMGKQYGAEYLLTGNISEITQRNDKVTDVYFKVTLNLKNLSTGLLDWSSEKEIRKTSTRRTFGG